MMVHNEEDIPDNEIRPTSVQMAQPGTTGEVDVDNGKGALDMAMDEVSHALRPSPPHHPIHPLP